MDRLIETRHVSAVEYREVTAARGQQQNEDPNRWLFLPQASGDSISLPSNSDPQDNVQLYWHLHNHTVSTLSLAEVSLQHGQLGKGLQLQIPGQVFSAVAYNVASDACYVFLLLSSKAVGVLRLPLARQAQQQPQQQQSSILDGVHAQNLRRVSVSEYLASAGVPTAVAASDGYLCISGSEGGVTCLPLASLMSGQQPGPASVLQLNPSNLLSQVRRRMGFAASSSVVAVLPVAVPAAAGANSSAGQVQQQSLLVVHDDSSCHQWFIPQSRQGFSHVLVADAAARQLRPNKVLLCQTAHDTEATNPRLPALDVLLVWDMVVADSSGQSDIRVMPFKFQTVAATAVAPARLEPQLQQAQQLALEWPDASLINARVVGVQLLLLCRRAAGGHFVASYSCRDWSYRGRCQLLQQKVSADWGVAEELWSCALAAFPDATSPAEHVLSQLLVPGQLCLSSLRQALAYHGSQLTETEAATATLAQLKMRITAAVELIQSKFPSYSSPRCWHMLFASYCEFWQQQHALLALYSNSSSSGGGWLGTVRAGGQLTVLRKPSPAEILLVDSSAAALDYVLQVVGSQGTTGIPGGAAALAKVRLCLSAVGDILGQPAMRVMTQLVMAGVSVEGQLLPKFVELLLQGPAAAAADGAGLSTGEQQRLSEWRMRRQARLLFIQEQLAELPHALETLSGVAELTIKTAVVAADQLQAPAAAAAVAAPAPQLSTLLSTVSLHTARAACMALQQQLLLLGLLTKIGSVGSTPLTAADQAAVHSDLIPPLTSALQSVAVALWICKTPASRSVAGFSSSSSTVNPTVGPLLGLRAPTPSGTPASTPRGASAGALATPTAAAAAAASTTTAAPAIWQQPLAAHLLPMFWKQQCTAAAADQLGKRVGSLGQQLAVWLMLGGSSDAAAAAPSLSSAYAAVTNSKDLAGRAVLLAYQLFVCREYEAMQKLVRLVGGEDPSESGLQFILGLSIACGIRSQGLAGSSSALYPDQRLKQLDSAVGHLFRAAAGLCSEGSGPLRQVLQLLRQRQGSSSSSTAAAAQGIEQLQIADPAVAAAAGMETYGVPDQRQQQQQQSADQAAAIEAQIRLEYCQAVMLLFEREGVTEGALAFARAALGAVDAACGEEHQQDKIQQQASLWTSVFNFACDLGLNHDAYTAAIANPIPDKAADSIRRLVQALVDQGELAQLLALPWAGVVELERKGIREPVPVVQLVIDKLERRALHSELSLQPSSHHVLYDFLVAWGNHKHAAAAMLAYARRLRAAAAKGMVRHLTGEALIAEISGAYGASVATLQLLNPADAWLDPDQPLLAPHPAPTPRLSTKQQQQHRNTNSHDSLTLPHMPSELPVITLQALQQESELFTASVLLLDHSPGLDIMMYETTAEYIVEQLLGTQQFAAAVRIIHVMWNGQQQQQLGEKLETVAYELASCCVGMQMDQESETVDTDPSSSSGNLGQMVLSYTGPGYLGSSAAAAWHKLRQLLEVYDRYSLDNTNGAAAVTARAPTASSPIAAGLKPSSSSSVTALGGRMRVAAVDGALSALPGLHLPPWLTQPFQPRAGIPGGMAGSGPDPAALLRVYIKHGRLILAAELLKSHLDAWQRQSPLLRVQPCAVWLPVRDMELLHASLVAGAQRANAGRRVEEAELLGVWSEVLQKGLDAHMKFVSSDGDKLGVESVAGGSAIGMVY